MSFNNPFSSGCRSDDGNFGCFEEMDDGDSCAAVFTDDLPSTMHSQSVRRKKLPALPVRVDSHTFEISLGGARINSITESSSATGDINTCIHEEESKNCEEFAGPFFDDESPSISTTDPILDPPTLLWDSGRSSTGAALLAVKIAKCKEALKKKAPDNTCSTTSDQSEEPTPLSYPDIKNLGPSTTSNIGIGQLSQQGFTKDVSEDDRENAAVQKTAASSSTKISLDPPKRDTLVRDRSLQSHALMEELITVSKDSLKKPSTLTKRTTLHAITTVPPSPQRAFGTSSSSSPRPKSTRILVVRRDNLLSCPSPSRSRRKVGSKLLSPRSKPRTSRRSPSPVSSPRSSDQQQSSPTEDKSNSDHLDRASSPMSRRRPNANSNPRRSRTPSSKQLSWKAGVDSASPSRPRRVSPSCSPVRGRGGPSHPRPERRSSTSSIAAESPPRRPRRLAVDSESPSPGRAHRRSSIGANSPPRRPIKVTMAADLKRPSPGSPRIRSSGESQPRKSSSGDLGILSPRGPRRNPINSGGTSPRCPRANGDNENMRSRRPKSRHASPSPRAQQTDARHAASLVPQDKEERPEHSAEEESRTSSEEGCLDTTVEQASPGRQSPRERRDSEKVDEGGETRGDYASNMHPPLAPILTPRVTRVLCEIPAAAARRTRRRQKIPSASSDDSPTKPGTAVVSTSSLLPPTTPRSQKRRVSAHLLLRASEERAKSIAKARREAGDRRAQIAIDT